MLLVLGNSTLMGAYLSPLNVDLAEKVLISRLEAASTFDSKYQQFATLGFGNKDLQTTAKATLQTSQDAQKTYQLLADTAKGNYEAALISLSIAQTNFNDLQTLIPDRQKAFQDGIEEYKKKEVAEAVIDGLFAVVLIAGTIAVAVIAPPAGAAVATGAVAELTTAVKVGTEVAEKVSTLVSFINKLKEMLEKIVSALEKIAEMVRSIEQIVALMVTFKRVDKENPNNADGGLKLPSKYQPSD